MCGEMEQLPHGLQILVALLSSTVRSLLTSPLSDFYLSISHCLFSLFLSVSLLSLSLSQTLFFPLLYLSPSVCLFFCLYLFVCLCLYIFAVRFSLCLWIFESVSLLGEPHMAGREVPCAWIRVCDVPTGYLRKRGYEGEGGFLVVWGLSICLRDVGGVGDRGEVGSGTTYTNTPLASRPSQFCPQESRSHKVETFTGKA